MLVDVYVQVYSLEGQSWLGMYGALRQQFSPGFYWESPPSLYYGHSFMALGGERVQPTEIQFRYLFEEEGLGAFPWGGILSYLSADALHVSSSHPTEQHWLPRYWLVLDDEQERIYAFAQVPQGQAPDFWALEEAWSKWSGLDETFMLDTPWESPNTDEEWEAQVSSLFEVCAKGQAELICLPRYYRAYFSGDVWAKYRILRRRHRFFCSFLWEQEGQQLLGVVSHWQLRGEASSLKAHLLAGAWGRTGNDMGDWQRVQQLLQHPSYQGPHLSQVQAWQGRLQAFGQVLSDTPLLQTIFTAQLLEGFSTVQVEMEQPCQALDLLHGLQPSLALGIQPQAALDALQQVYNQPFFAFGGQLLISDQKGHLLLAELQRVALAQQGVLHTHLPATIHNQIRRKQLQAEAQRHRKTVMEE
jgi:hypothetical protein